MNSHSGLLNHAFYSSYLLWKLSLNINNLAGNNLNMFILFMNIRSLNVTPTVFERKTRTNQEDFSTYKSKFFVSSEYYIEITSSIWLSRSGKNTKCLHSSLYQQQLLFKQFFIEEQKIRNNLVCSPNDTFIFRYLMPFIYIRRLIILSF